MKLAKRIGLVVVILLVVGVIAVTLSLNALVRAGAQTALNRSLQTPCKVGGVSVSILGGKFAMSEVAIGNPEGYQNPNAFAVDKMAVEAKILSFLGSEAVVRDIVIEAPEVNIEQKGNTTNFGELLDRLSKNDGAKEPTKKPKKGKKKDGKSIRVDRVLLTDITVRFASELLGGEGVTAKVPKIEIEDIGTGGDGVQMAYLIRVVLQEILEASAEAGIGLPPQLARILDGDIERVAAQFQRQVDKAVSELTSQESLKEIADDPDKAMKKAEKAFGDLLGGKKDKKR